MNNIIAFDIGGSSIKWGIVDESGKILLKEWIRVPKDAKTFLNDLFKLVNDNKEEFKLKGIAISAPGAVNSETGFIGGSSAIPYIHFIDFKNEFLNNTGLKVSIENDANCAALGEGWLGASKEANDSVFVICGTGIGGAIVKDRRIHKGFNGHGGEFGYCFMRTEDNEINTWSRIGSTRALARNVAKKKGLEMDSLDGEKVFEMSNHGDKCAIEEVNKFYFYMALGIYNIQYTYDPEVIVIGGAISERKDFLEALNSAIDKVVALNKDGKIRPIIKKCVYGNDANKLGAVYHFLNEYC